MTKKEIILAAIDDLVSDLLYYDRKEDEELSSDDIDECIESGEVTIEEMVTQFKKSLDSSFD